ncbi:hypothetical protein HHI36_012731 [Cryptolaemus montrouzieri]|uniref:Uncharacterized protein n=1 Tax=Cryptolaemus montrouzieri TaxID=559131 RepID=A0ABD2NG38_9CUCU
MYYENEIEKNSNDIRKKWKIVSSLVGQPESREEITEIVNPINKERIIRRSEIKEVHIKKVDETKLGTQKTIKEVSSYYLLTNQMLRKVSAAFKVINPQDQIISLST